MILAIDIGNSNIVFGVYDEDVLIYQFRIRSEHTKTTDEYASSILYLIERNGINIKNISGVIVASVVPSLEFTIGRFVRKYLNAEPMAVGSENIQTGIVVKMENPKEVGADRLVNAAAAVNKLGAPCVVIDFGTATTLDIVNRNGEYIGGIICPGVMLSAQALHSNTAKLPEISVDKPKTVVGKNTIHSMQSGIFYGYLAMVNGLLDMVLDEEFQNAEDVNLVVTGGLGSIFYKEIKYPALYEPSLTLYGLKLIYDKNNLTRFTI